MSSLNQKGWTNTKETHIFLLAIHKRALCSRQDRETCHGCHLTTNPSSNIRRVRFVPLGDALRLIFLKGDYLEHSIRVSFIYILSIKKKDIYKRQREKRYKILFKHTNKSEAAPDDGLIGLRPQQKWS